MEENAQLSPKVKKLIEHQICFVHIASFWEIAIKVSIGKLSLTYTIDQMIAQLRKEAITILPISEKAIEEIKTLPLHHRDPFDRLLIAEAITQNYILLSIDTQIDPYPVQRIW
ncbi:type II toxin-antitoxin system VapC family toxin [Runella aurantiaca]|uniref:Type II toxin-antitoxin system VapC family toxin n=1 Tax=Runella aurantiaca TaxID=2282308 RepID=A0A369I1C6_9BACT|nr:type II toxin-antitoxin system VapC family toxin [Runella aurantiaca]RDB02822.1 type II toxin-antitoxin system VapC family toxin [Runella aurantiaca]